MYINIFNRFTGCIYIYNIYNYMCILRSRYSRIFNVAVWSSLLSLSFHKYLLSDVPDDLFVRLKLDVCWLYRVLNSFSVIPMYMSSLIVLVCVTVAW